ncbi:hypothetical protein J6590_025076 [Homalodisca vitripennis]|nr:hypothetical protein J6590_025076 [Homalodisca vitripennis]
MEFRNIIDINVGTKQADVYEVKRCYTIDCAEDCKLGLPPRLWPVYGLAAHPPAVVWRTPTTTCETMDKRIPNRMHA